MTKKEKMPASITLEEINKEIAKGYREKAKNLIECADIIEGKEPTNDKYDLLKEFVEWLKKRLDEQCTHLKNGDEFDLERSIGIHIVLSNLDKHLEKFLEERENG